MRPEDNYRVLQDNNPVKNAAYKEALKRYEEDLFKKKREDEKQLNLHKEKIIFDDGEQKRLNLVKQSQQEKFKKNITEQM